MSDIGFTNAAQNDMTIAVGKGEPTVVTETYQSTWVLVLGMSAMVIVFVVGAVTILPLAAWLNLTTLSPNAAAWIIVLLSLQVLMSLQTGLIYCGFHCRGSYGFGQFLLASIRLLELFFLAAAVLLYGDPVVAAAALLSGRITGAVAMWVLLRRVNSDLALGWRYARWATVKRLAGPAVAFTAFPLGNALNVQGVVIVIGVTLGPAAVAVFATLRTLTRFGVQLVGAVDRIVQAEIAGAFGAGNTELLRKLHHHACQAALWISAALAVGLVILGDWVVRIWTDGAIEVQEGLFYVLLAVMVVNGLWQASVMLVYATNRHQRAAVIYLGASLGVVAVAYAVVSPFGLVGIAGALLAAEIMVAANVCRVSLGLLNESPRQFAHTLATAPLFVFKRLR